MQVYSSRLGLFLALAAYVWWGLAPIYFKVVNWVGPVEIVAHRVIWSCLILAVLVSFLRLWPKFWALCTSGRSVVVLCSTSLLIGSNWLVFIWAVNNNLMVEASLGYFINPLLNILLGRIFLQERLQPLQLFAVVLAFSSLLIQLLVFGSFSWVSLALAGSFAFYGLLRKQLGADAFSGLLFETLVLFIPAIIFLYISPSETSNIFNNSLVVNLVLMLVGIITTVPLLLFASAVKYLSLTSIGFIQYLAPSLTLLLGVVVYKEAFTLDKALTFILIWCALAIYSVDALKKAKKNLKQV